MESHATSVGIISYVASSESKNTGGGESGLIRAEIQYIYDMKVGKDVIPIPNDTEASSINLYNVMTLHRSVPQKTDAQSPPREDMRLRQDDTESREQL